MRPHLRIFENERVALPILVRELGVICAIGIIVRVQKALYEGAPFGDIESDGTDEGRRCRELIGPAVALYKELQRRELGPRAFDIAREVILDAGIQFINRQFEATPVDEFLEGNAAERRAIAGSFGERFPNADIQWNHLGQRYASFTVMRCRFPALCVKAGVPELAPLFCEVDRHYVDRSEHNVQLRLPTTIARGGETCPFEVYWTLDKDRKH